jgi:hypothetical protein
VKIAIIYFNIVILQVLGLDQDKRRIFPKKIGEVFLSVFLATGAIECGHNRPIVNFNSDKVESEGRQMKQS